MNCALGFGIKVSELYSMDGIQRLACKYYDYLGASYGDSESYKHAELLCSLATKHVAGTFRAFQEEFCKTALPEILEIASSIDNQWSKSFAVICALGAAGTVVCRVQSAYADAETKKELTYFSNLLGAATLFSAIFGYKAVW